VLAGLKLLTWTPRPWWQVMGHVANVWVQCEMHMIFQTENLKVRYHVRHQGVYKRIILQQTIKTAMWRCKLQRAGSAQDLFVGSWGHRNGTSGSTKDGEFLASLSDYQFLRVVLVLVSQRKQRTQSETLLTHRQILSECLWTVPYLSLQPATCYTLQGHDGGWKSFHKHIWRPQDDATRPPFRSPTFCYATGSIPLTSVTHIKHLKYSWGEAIECSLMVCDTLRFCWWLPAFRRRHIPEDNRQQSKYYFALAATLQEQLTWFEAQRKPSPYDKLFNPSHGTESLFFSSET
jgi:hypothetical protein